ncbi:putative outer membrane protein PmpA [Dissostichus eleginoides]|uniref:Outer membrane protein PmpA n=1 Tax=Dissostichus eleginoides TaxID=100907 RepID=A0AAD9CCK0_DISEL|nr:putative outer membrane protein PmpA [Dissostichus eleginoides]
MMELRIMLIPTGEIILSPGKNGDNYCHGCKIQLSFWTAFTLQTDERHGPNMMCWYQHGFIELGNESVDHDLAAAGWTVVTLAAIGEFGNQ